MMKYTIIKYVVLIILVVIYMASYNAGKYQPVELWIKIELTTMLLGPIFTDFLEDKISMTEVNKRNRTG